MDGQDFLRTFVNVSISPLPIRLVNRARHTCRLRLRQSYVEKRMRISDQGAQVSKSRLRAGWALTALPAAFLLLDSLIHLMNTAPVQAAFRRLGYPVNLATNIGIVELVCLIFCVIPRTSMLGAILLTGYLGGAIASNLRVETPVFSHVLFPLYLGVPLWAGLYLRDGRLRELIPLRSGGGEI